MSFAFTESDYTATETIQCQIGFRPMKTNHQRLPATRISIDVNRKGAIIQTLYNARSLFPKIASLLTDIEERAVDVCFVTEI